MQRNVELLRKVADAIEQNLDQFYMGDWWLPAADDCGATYCVAGWAMALSGYRPNFALGCSWLDPAGNDHMSGTEETALRLLGFESHPDGPSGSKLFYSFSDEPEDIVARLRELADGGPLHLD